MKSALMMSCVVSILLISTHRMDGAIAETAGDVVEVNPPLSVFQGAFENNTQISAFNEAQGITLPAGVGGMSLMLLKRR